MIEDFIIQDSACQKVERKPEDEVEKEVGGDISLDNHLDVSNRYDLVLRSVLCDALLQKAEKEVDVENNETCILTVRQIFILLDDDEAVEVGADDTRKHKYVLPPDRELGVLFDHNQVVNPVCFLFKVLGAVFVVVILLEALLDVMFPVELFCSNEAILSDVQISSFFLLDLYFLEYLVYAFLHLANFSVENHVLVFCVEFALVKFVLGYRHGFLELLKVVGHLEQSLFQRFCFFWNLYNYRR